MLLFWDRTTSTVYHPPTPSDVEEQTDISHPTSGRGKPGKKGKDDKKAAGKAKENEDTIDKVCTDRDVIQ